MVENYAKGNFYASFDRSPRNSLSNTKILAWRMDRSEINESINRSMLSLCCKLKLHACRKIACSRGNFSLKKGKDHKNGGGV